MGFELLLDRVAIRVEKVEKIGSIFVPDNAQENQQYATGTVVALGPGKWNPDFTARVSLTAHVGDRVLYQRYKSIEVEINGEKLTIQDHDQIVCIFR